MQQRKEKTTVQPIVKKRVRTKSLEPVADHSPSEDRSKDSDRKDVLATEMPDFNISLLRKSFKQ
jgi:hypothetical protein